MNFTNQQIEAILEAFAPDYGDIGPTREQLRTLLSHPGDGRVHMINLLKFREKAEYPAEHEFAGAAGGTGSDAYARYGLVAIRKVAERGGRLVWMGIADQVLIGDLQEWDQVAILEYPDRAAFLDMIQDPEYRAAHVHREAGLERTALIAASPVVDASRS